MQIPKGNLTDSDISDWLSLPATKIFFEFLEQEKEDLQKSALTFFKEGDMEKTFSAIAEISGAIKNMIWIFESAHSNSSSLFKFEKEDLKLEEIELHDEDY